MKSLQIFTSMVSYKVHFYLMIAYTFFFTQVEAQVHTHQTFSNPLLAEGPDPWIIAKDGFYYYTNSTGHNITIWKTKHIADLKTAQKKVVYVPPATGPYSKELWAPEIHFLEGKWY